MRNFIWTWLFCDGSLLEQQIPAASWNAANDHAAAALMANPAAVSVTVEMAP